MGSVKSSGLGTTRQKGLAILVVTILLLLVATIGTFTIGKVALMEQKIVGADVRRKEVYSAAIGGLEYGVSWFEDNWDTLTWTDADNDGNAETGDQANPAALANATLNADGYAHTISYTLVTDLEPADGSGNPLETMPIIVTVVSTATAVGDSHVSKTVSIDVMLGKTDLFADASSNGFNTFSGPPLLAENCANNFHGNPDIYPNPNHGVAIGTTLGDEDAATTNDGSPPCINPGSHLDIHGGTTQALLPHRTLWNTVFGAGVTEADLRALEAREPERVHVVDSTYPHYPSSQPSFNGNNWHASLGTASSPVILYFDSSVGCPNINGSPTIYGLVYYEIGLDAFGNPLCTYQGWGGADVYGTVAVSGAVTAMNANGVIHGRDLDFGGGGGGGGRVIDLGLTLPQFSEIPGSWRDY